MIGFPNYWHYKKIICGWFILKEKNILKLIKMNMGRSERLELFFLLKFNFQMIWINKSNIM
jgi:hypothetical protein